MSMLPRLRPRCFYDLVIEVAIVRPGPIQGTWSIPICGGAVARSRSRFPAKQLRTVSGKNAGRAAVSGTGHARGDGRRGFHRRRSRQAPPGHGRVATHRGDRNVSIRRSSMGCSPTATRREFAEQCFNQIKGFGEYGFPESHAASFALLVYVSAWLKRHHPAAFAAALLNSQPMGFYMPAQIVRDAQEHGVEVRPVDVNESDWDCTLESELHDLKATTALRATHADAGFQPASSRRILEASHHSKAELGSRRPCFALGFRQLKGFARPMPIGSSRRAEPSGTFNSIEQFHRVTRLAGSCIADSCRGRCVWIAGTFSPRGAVGGAGTEWMKLLQQSRGQAQPSRICSTARWHRSPADPLVAAS